jgi:hypothetical protein
MAWPVYPVNRERKPLRCFGPRTTSTFIMVISLFVSVYKNISHSRHRFERLKYGISEGCSWI